LLPVLFAVTLFVGAALLFLVQPLVGKLLLPLVGGSPGVWNTCMVFFQTLLLAGYLYAHRSTGRLGVRQQVVFHTLLLAAVLVSFKLAHGATGSPVAVMTSLLPEDRDYPIGGLVGLLAVAVGVPFFVLSTTSPLLQRWFAATGCRSARDPYFLYAASNAGSLLGLLGYPFLIEPRLTLAEQRWLFAAGVAAYCGLVMLCAFTIVGRGARGVDPEPKGEEGGGKPEPELCAASAAIPASRVARWVFLAALPSSLLLGVTTHVSTNLAPVPLLWAVPLSLYLVSFILVFARWSDRVHRAVGWFTPVLILFAALSLLMEANEPFVLIGALHLGAFFGVCLVCHGELAKDRPPPRLLTAFYFWMSVGGVLGGLFNGLIAPVVFHRLGMVEYPLALILAAGIRPRTEGPPEEPPLRVADVLLVLVLLGISVGLVLLVPKFVAVPTGSTDTDAASARMLRGGLMFGLPAVAAFALVRRPARYALSLAALFVASAFDPGQFGETLHMERNFFGVLRVTRSPDGKFIRLIHGTSVHGQQAIDDPGDEFGRPQPLSYYYHNGPVFHLFDNLSQRRDDLTKRPVPLDRVGVVGLGTGAVAYYAKPGQKWTFFEIDPAVARIAQSGEYFTFLKHCRAESCEVVLGDARRQLARQPDGSFDLLIIDGFCSDSIPAHLLTQEALALYVRKLTPDGVLAIHVSNQHLELAPLVTRLAHNHEPPLEVRYKHDQPWESERKKGKSESEWMILARTNTALGPVGWWYGYWGGPVKMVPGPVWRDDFANVLAVWRRHRDE
jgi:hypothetical protein